MITIQDKDSHNFFAMTHTPGARDASDFKRQFIINGSKCVKEVDVFKMKDFNFNYEIDKFTIC